MAYEFVPHVFAQGHTIEGAIRFHNSLKMLPEHLEMMVEEFNGINKDVFPPVAGQVVKIPIMAEYEFEPVEPVVEPKEEKPKEVPKPPQQKLEIRRMPKMKDQKKVYWWK